MVWHFGLPYYTCIILTLFMQEGHLMQRCDEDVKPLYSEVDNVLVGLGDSLERSLAEPAMGKLVQFMNTYCGNCRRFAPTFKKMAVDLQKWNRALRIYAVDCALWENVKLCRDFRIRFTPTIRYFPSKFQRSRHETGTDIETQNPTEIVEQLIENLSENDYSGGSGIKLNFDPIEPDDELQEVYAQFDNKVSYILLVHPVEIGMETILNMLPYPDVGVRIIKDAEMFANFGLKPCKQKLALLNRSGRVQPIRPKGESSSAYVNSVAAFLERNGHPSMPTWPIAPAPENNLSDEYDAIIVDYVLHSRKVLFQDDLEQAIQQLLHVEIPKTPFISGYKFKALRHIIRLLRRFNVLGRDGRRMLNSLVKHLFEVDEITGEEFRDVVDDLQTRLDPIFTDEQYVGCLGSTPHTRRYSCSLWTLFHYLTVLAAQAKTYPPSSVTIGLYGLAKYFYGCQDGAKHFMKLAKRRMIAQVTSHDEEILWLWEIHNEVNEKLAGDASEDPRFPKVQFPERKHCPECYSEDSDEFDRDEVLKYMKRVYDLEYLSIYDLPDHHKKAKKCTQ
ncbi:sulfhydryl oxidase 2 isoform X1 [Drosophila yakuba]|uniref:sulfhydryl oxidase 2 isoform X1 n=1 Tax=Drosophila yakuba TaxID=7245 RepID=UPI00017DCFDE|nr:sulfhydryl oxidase 2 isoform X1 [Drosophila yakuba]